MILYQDASVVIRLDIKSEGYVITTHRKHGHEEIRPSSYVTGFNQLIFGKGHVTKQADVSDLKSGAQ